MKVSKWHLFPLLLLITLPFQSSCAATVPTGDLSRIDALNQRLGRGINVANALEAPAEGKWGLTLQASYFTEIRRAGFQSIRLPVRWSAHADAEPPYTIEPDFFQRVDWVLEQASANDLAVILNVHHYDELYRNPDKEEGRFHALWDQIAIRYQSRGEWLYFELLNEPHDAFDSQTWNQFLIGSLAEIRKTNPSRPVLVGPVYWNNVRHLESLELPDTDPNLIVTFHYYYPYTFTHQGADWMPPEFRDRKNVPWSLTDDTLSAVHDDLDLAVEYREATERPINLGEYGTYYTADMESRIQWTRTVTRAARERGFSIHYWEFGAGFGLYDTRAGQWREPLLDAVIQARENYEP